MKNIFIIASTVLATAGAFHSCKKADPVIRMENKELSDIYLTMDRKASVRLFDGKYSVNKDTIYFDVPWFLPPDFDEEVDLTKLIVKATIPIDAKISPALGGIMDLSKPLDLTVTAGNGEQSKYVVVAKKVGDMSVTSATIQFNNGGITETIEGVVQDNEILFYVLPGVDVSDAKLTYAINPHSNANLAQETSINLSSNVPFTVTGVDGKSKTYTLRATEPVKLPYGFGINRNLWTKPGTDLGFTDNNDVCLAVSGDNLVILKRTSPSKFSVFNRFTGTFVKDMYNPFATVNFQLVNDSADHLLAASWAPKNSKFILYRYNNVDDITPVKLVEWTNNNPNGITGDGGVGRRVNVYGDLTKTAVIMAVAGQSDIIYKWRIENGVAVSQTPQVIKYQSIAGGSSVFTGYYCEAQPISAEPNGDYIINYQFEVAHVSGINNQRLNALSLGWPTVFTMPTSYARFNNANYMAIVQYVDTYDLNKTKMSLYDVTTLSRMGMPQSDPEYNKFNVFNSALISGTKNGNGTADIAIGFSQNKERMQVYMLLTNGGVMAHEFTTYAP